MRLNILNDKDINDNFQILLNKIFELEKIIQDNQKTIRFLRNEIKQLENDIRKFR